MFRAGPAVLGLRSLELALTDLGRKCCLQGLILQCLSFDGLFGRKSAPSTLGISVLKRGYGAWCAKVINSSHVGPYRASLVHLL